MDDPRVAIAAIQERLGSLDGKVTSAHSRVDKMESLIREDLKEMKAEFKEVSNELKDVIAWMNSGKASIKIMLAIGGVAASAIGGLISWIVSRNF